MQLNCCLTYATLLLLMACAICECGSDRCLDAQASLTGPTVDGPLGQPATNIGSTSPEFSLATSGYVSYVLARVNGIPHVVTTGYGPQTHAPAIESLLRSLKNPNGTAVFDTASVSVDGVSGAITYALHSIDGSASKLQTAHLNAEKTFVLGPVTLEPVALGEARIEMSDGRPQIVQFNDFSGLAQRFADLQPSFKSDGALALRMFHDSNLLAPAADFRAFNPTQPTLNQHLAPGFDALLAPSAKGKSVRHEFPNWLSSVSNFFTAISLSKGDARKDVLSKTQTTLNQHPQNAADTLANSVENGLRAYHQIGALDSPPSALLIDALNAVKNGKDVDNKTLDEATEEIIRLARQLKRVSDTTRIGKLNVPSAAPN